jgi:hypothetical protein
VESHVCVVLFFIVSKERVPKKNYSNARENSRNHLL